MPLLKRHFSIGAAQCRNVRHGGHSVLSLVMSELFDLLHRYARHRKCSGIWEDLSTETGVLSFGYSQGGSERQ